MIRRFANGFSRREIIGMAIVSVLFGLLNMAGQYLFYYDRLPNSGSGWLTFGLCSIGCSVLFFIVACIVVYSLPFLLVRTEKSIERDSRGKRAAFAVAFAVILLGWLPWIISYYPCSADYDVYRPIEMYLNLAERSNNFPWFYATVVGALYSIGLKLGDRNIGLFLHIALRAPLMAAIYAYLVAEMRQRGLRKGVLWFVTLYYALVPVWGAYAKHAFKDTISAALFCWYIIWTIETADSIRKGDCKAKPFAFYALSSLLIALFRNNCFYIAIPVTVLLIIAIFRQPAYRNIRFKIGVLCAAGLVVFSGYQQYILKVVKINPGTIGSAITIPLQQTARTVRDEGEGVTDEEREIIASVMDYDRLPELYDPILSDPVKDTFSGRKNGFNYMLTWMKMFPKHRQAYVEAAIAQGYGYYAFTPDQPEHAGNWNSGMTIFNWVQDPRFSPDFCGEYIEALEPGRTALDDWAKTWHRLPLLGLTDEPPLYTWLIVLIGMLIAKQNNKTGLIPILACLLNVLFCCCSPVNDCFRYFAPIAAAAPACLLLLARSKSETSPQ